MDKKIKELLSELKFRELLHRKSDNAKKSNPYIIVLVVIGAIALIAAIAYAVYYFIAPDKLVDFEDDMDDDAEIFNEDAGRVKTSNADKAVAQKKHGLLSK